jgi:hypothetical protein
MKGSWGFSCWHWLTKQRVGLGTSVYETINTFPHEVEMCGSQKEALLKDFQLNSH